MLKRIFIIISTLTLIILVGCSQPTSTNKSGTKNATSKEEESINEIEEFEAAKDVEGMLREGPGIYAGEEYDQKKVEHELDKFPENITAEEAYNRLVYLLAEDYEVLIDEMNNLDISYTLDRELPSGVKGEGNDESNRVNVSILLDASGSMNDKVSGGVKMDLAKQAIQQFASDLPEGVNVSLRVFGHKEGKSKKESCQSSEIVYPLSPYDKASFDSALNKFGAQGWTPLAKGIRDAQNDLAQHNSDGVQNIVYVVSDGMETCGGDPVKEAKALHNSDMKAIVNIIGFNVSNKEQRALKEVAKAGGGVYKSASSVKDLEEQLRKERRQLQEELRHWSHLTLRDLSQRRDELIGQKREIRESLYKMNQLETKRLSEAQDYLSRRGIRPEGLRKLISTRYNNIHDYIGPLDKTVDEKILKGYLDAIQELRDKKKDVLGD